MPIVSERLPERRTGAEVVLADAALLAEGRLACSVSILSDRCLTLGVSQRDGSPSERRARELDVAVCRRSSGGTGVYTAPGDLSWSLVLPREDPRVGRGYVRAYGRLGGPVALALAEAGHPAAWRPAPGLADEVCVLSARGQVLETGGRIVGGAAQHLTGRALLHHGFIARAAEPERISRIFGIPPELARAHLAGWQDVGPRVAPDDLARQITGRLVEYVSAPGALS